MASFRLDVKPNRRAAARFVGKVRRELQAAVVADRERLGITQTKIADAIGVHRSVISRELNGRQDITLGRVAELAWAMGREIEFELKVPKLEVGQNIPKSEAGVVEKADSRPTVVTEYLPVAQRENRIKRSNTILEMAN